MQELVAAQEIGRMLGGLSRQRVTQLVGSADFPAPVATLSVGRIWRREDVAEWARRNGRTIT